MQMVGGGVPGKAGGIGRAIMIPVGSGTKTLPPSIVTFPMTGAPTIEIDIGRAGSGTSIRYHISRFKRTGTAGKPTGIGKATKVGAFRTCNVEGIRHGQRIKSDSRKIPGDIEQKMYQDMENNA